MLPEKPGVGRTLLSAAVDFDFLTKRSAAAKLLLSPVKQRSKSKAAAKTGCVRPDTAPSRIHGLDG
jgi:hypothetical protein